MQRERKLELAINNDIRKEKVGDLRVESEMLSNLPDEDAEGNAGDMGEGVMSRDKRRGRSRIDEGTGEGGRSTRGKSSETRA
jgi:hypothetical protein